MEKCRFEAEITLEKCRFSGVFAMEKCQFSDMFALEKCQFSVTFAIEKGVDYDKSEDRQLYKRVLPNHAQSTAYNRSATDWKNLFHSKVWEEL